MAIDLYVTKWLSLLLRWAHIVTGIAWIGASFYFIWLDARLNVPPRNPEDADVAGDLWAVHGGGFYHSQKYQVSPPELPEPLHWFKWEAYFTWMTGFALFIVVYYLNAEAMLIDPAVLPLSPAGAAIISVALLLAGWLLYEGLCVQPGGHDVLGTGHCAAARTLLGRESPLHRSRCLHADRRDARHDHGRECLFIIIPSQKQLVAAKLRGEHRTRASARAPSNARCTTTT